LWPRQELAAAREELRRERTARNLVELDFTHLLQCASEARTLLVSAGHGQAAPGTGVACTSEWAEFNTARRRQAEVWLERGGARLLHMDDEDESSESD